MTPGLEASGRPSCHYCNRPLVFDDFEDRWICPSCDRGPGS